MSARGRIEIVDLLGRARELRVVVLLAIAAAGLLSMASTGGVAAASAESPAKMPSPATDDSLVRIRALLAAGRYSGADSLALRLIARIESEAGLDSLRWVDYADAAVDALSRDGRGNEPRTRRLAERALAIRERRLEPGDPGLAASLERLGRLMIVDDAELAVGIPLLERALAIRERSLGTEHPEVARTLFWLGMLWRGRFDWARAKPLFERALAIREKTLGDRHPDVGESLYGLANVLHETGHYEQALPMRLRSLSILEQALGPDHPEVARSLNALGNLYRDMGDPMSARPLLERGLAIRRRALRPDHPDIAASMNNLANVLHETGDYAAAMPLREEVLRIWETSEGPASPGAAKALINLANLLGDTGEYSRSQRLLERALEISEKTLGPENPLVATAADALADVLHLLGDDSRERPLRERALEIWQKSEGPESPWTAREIRGMANLERDTGNFEAAAKLYARDLEILRAIDPTAADLPSLLLEIGALHVAQGDYRAAEAACVEALQARERALGPASPILLHVLLQLATARRLEGKADSARATYQRAIAIGERSDIANDPDLAAAIEGLAILDAADGRFEAAFDGALRAERIGRDRLRLIAGSLPESQSLRYASLRSSGLALALSVLDRQSAADATRRAFDAWIRSRGVVLDAMARRHHAISTSRDSELAGLEASFASASTRYANLAVRGPDPDHPERYASLLERAREQRDSVERALAERSAAFRSTRALEDVGLERVAHALEPDQALVSFVRYSPPAARRRPGPSGSELATGGRYMALVLRGSAEPIARAIGDGRTIDSLVTRWQSMLSNPILAAAPMSEARCRSAGDALRRAIWDPIAPLLGPSKTVFVVPDGDLSLVNFGTLPTGPSGYLVESGPLLHYLSAERDAARPSDGRRGPERVLAIGGVVYDARRGVETRGTKPEGENHTPVVASAYRGPRPDCGEFRSRRFLFLPGSLREIHDVIEAWSIPPETLARSSPSIEGDRPVLDRLTGVEATESAFKRLAPTHSIVHVATHAYFVAGACGPPIPGSRGIGAVSFDRPPPAEPARIENPYLLSGLALAGANRREAAAPDEEDGILTAEEIAALDLTGVEWAVLSGCETAVGEPRAGEGVFGLRRAFEMAGARTLIMSLWSVGDESARRWMASLYRARVRGRLSTPEAVREATVSRLRERRADGLSTHPFYWGAFVAAGDWR